MDEIDQPFVVKWFPNQSCSFKFYGQAKCSHLLAVMQSNEMSITNY